MAPRKPKIKPPPLPKKVTIKDEHGQPWQVDDQDEFWPKALELTENGTKEAVVALEVIIANRGWGWWSCFKTQDDWLRDTGIPIPDHQTMDGLSGANATDLTPMLQRFGGYVAFLEVQVGLLAGRKNALKNAYDAAVLVHTSDIERSSEKAKEAQALASSETLRQTKRLYIETDMLYETAKGMCEAYVKAYEAVSRIVSVRLAEMDLSPRRVP